MILKLFNLKIANMNMCLMKPFQKSYLRNFEFSNLTRFIFHTFLLSFPFL